LGTLIRPRRSRLERFLEVGAYPNTHKKTKEQESPALFQFLFLVESAILDKVGTIQQMLAINFFAFDCVNEE
jgi:hypothetical protein